ncbi:MAG: nucleoside deaminase [Candidatus Omnitrophota bacterium]
MKKIIQRSHDEIFMRKAIAKAKEGIRNGQTPFGACLVRDNEIISCEHNVVWRSLDITAHAEIHAIRKACRKLKTIDLSDCILYSTCEPCPMCFSAAHWARISKVVYGAGIRDAQKAGFNELTVSNAQLKSLGQSPMRVTKNCLRSENIDLFCLWSRQAKKRVY